MTDAPYRSGPRVEHRVRELTDEEKSLVRSRLERWRADRARHEPKPWAELSGAVLVVLGAIGYGAWSRNTVILVIGGIALAFFAWLIAVATKKRRERSEAARGPWHAPEGGWKVRETIIVARSVVGSASGDEDYTYWTLFEIPRGAWFFEEYYTLADASPGERLDLAREHVHLTRLWPHGRYLSASASGDAIPQHGARGTPEDRTGTTYAADLERGWEWHPPFLESEQGSAVDAAQLAMLEQNLIPESMLPAWMRALVHRDV